MSKTSSGRSREYGYRIEVRDTCFISQNPVRLHDGCVGPDWREWTPAEDFNPAGIPIESPRFSGQFQHSLLPYEGAMALAWTILAQNSLHRGLECRLVRYKLAQTWELTREGVVEGRVTNDWIFSKIQLEPEPEGEAKDPDRAEETANEQPLP